MQGICNKCGKEFEHHLSPEEHLLMAIMGDTLLCKDCRVKEYGTRCSECGEYVEDVIGISGEQLCYPCLAKRYS